MCLFTNNVKPIKANKDLIVIKGLCRKGDSWVTPYQNSNVELNSLFKANGKVPNLSEDYSNNNIGEGVIHTYIDIVGNNDCTHFVKAVIKAGTDIYVQFDGKECASTEIEITDEIYTHSNINEISNVLKETRDTLCELLRSQNTNVDGVKIGDVLLSDKKTIIAPENITNDMEIIGIVSFIKDDKPHISALHQESQDWCIESTRDMDATNVITSYNDAINDFNGKEYTNNLREKYINKLDKFPALQYCIEYETEGTSKNDWYFPSTGEILQTVRNAFIINNTVAVINTIKGDKYAEPIRFDWFYWASAEGSSTVAWYCCTGFAYVYYSNKWGSGYVRPSFAFNCD